MGRTDGAVRAMGACSGIAESRQKSTKSSLVRGRYPLLYDKRGAGGCEKDYYGAALENLLVLLKRTKTFSLDFFSKSLFQPPLIPRFSDFCTELEAIIRLLLMLHLRHRLTEEFDLKTIQ